MAMQTALRLHKVKATIHYSHYIAQKRNN